MTGCEALSEALWSPENATTSIQANSDYLVYEGRATKQSHFWVVASGSNSTRAISATRHVSIFNSSLTLPAFCTQSAPLASKYKYDTSAEWRVTVHSNHEDLVGSVTLDLHSQPAHALQLT